MPLALRQVLFVLVIGTIWHPKTIAVFTIAGAGIAFLRERKNRTTVGRSVARYAAGILGGYLIGLAFSFAYAGITGERFGWLQ